MLAIDRVISRQQQHACMIVDQLDPEEQRVREKEKYGGCQNLEATTNLMIKRLVGDTAQYWNLNASV